MIRIKKIYFIILCALLFGCQFEPEVSRLNITSSFSNRIPKKYTCDGENVNPPLFINNLPNDTKSIVLIVEDPDATPVWYHWIVYNIPPTKEIKENTIPGIETINTWGISKYKGPCPPKEHRYFFKVYALDIMLDLDARVGIKGVMKAMDKHVVGYGELMGLYSR